MKKTMIIASLLMLAGCASVYTETGIKYHNPVKTIKIEQFTSNNEVAGEAVKKVIESNLSPFVVDNNDADIVITGMIVMSTSKYGDFISWVDIDIKTKTGSIGNLKFEQNYAASTYSGRPISKIAIEIAKRIKKKLTYYKS